jgi:hypothetical protein
VYVTVVACLYVTWSRAETRLFFDVRRLTVHFLCGEYDVMKWKAQPSCFLESIKGARRTRLHQIKAFFTIAITMGLMSHFVFMGHRFQRKSWTKHACRQKLKTYSDSKYYELNRILLSLGLYMFSFGSVQAYIGLQFTLCYDFVKFTYANHTFCGVRLATLVCVVTLLDHILFLISAYFFLFS